VEAYTGLSLTTRSWKLLLKESFKKKPYKVFLPRPPFQHILEVRLLREGKVIKLGKDAYQIEESLVDPLTASTRASFSLSPSLRLHRSDAIELLYSSGYGRDGQGVPAVLKHALLVGLAEFYENRGALPLHLTFFSLLKPFRQLEV